MVITLHYLLLKEIKKYSNLRKYELRNTVIIHNYLIESVSMVENNFIKSTEKINQKP